MVIGHVHMHARTATTPHLLERPVQQWAFLETAQAGHTPAIPPPQGASAYLRIFELVPLRRRAAL